MKAAIPRTTLRRRVLAIVILIGLAAGAAAAVFLFAPKKVWPFGVERGMTLKDVEACMGRAPDKTDWGQPQWDRENLFVTLDIDGKVERIGYLLDRPTMERPTAKRFAIEA